MNDLIWNHSNGLMVIFDKKNGYCSILLDFYFEHDFVLGRFSPLMYNVPKWSDRL